MSKPRPFTATLPSPTLGRGRAFGAPLFSDSVPPAPGADNATASVDAPIDIVYLWVDGSDPHWQAKHDAALALVDADADSKPAPHGDVQGRYRDNGELRYNLRALQRFFPQHGHIYIVTDGQRPVWLRQVPGLSVIDHRALMPATALPVFDSGHIESYLHHIPGLSERFIYLNDDVFFGAPFDPALWFSSRGVALYKEARLLPDYAGPQPHESALVNASLLSRAWLSKRDPAYRHVARIFAHAPRPMFTSVLHQLEREAPELFRQTRSTVFRSWAVPPLLPDLVPRWMVQTGNGVVRQGASMYLSSGDDDAAGQFAELEARFGQLLFFCINDTNDDADADSAPLLRIRRTLEALLPQPSRFEQAQPGDEAQLQQAA